MCRGRFWREYPNNHSLECTNWDGIVYWHAAAFPFLASLFPLTRNLLNKICKSSIHALDVTIDLANVLYVLPCFFFVLSKLLSFSSPSASARRTIRRARHDQIPNKSPFCRLGAIVVRQRASECADITRRSPTIERCLRHRDKKEKRSNACVQRTGQLSHRVRVLLEGRKVLRMCTVAQTEEERLVASHRHHGHGCRIEGGGLNDGNRGEVGKERGR